MPLYNLLQLFLYIAWTNDAVQAKSVAFMLQNHNHISVRLFCIIYATLLQHAEKKGKGWLRNDTAAFSGKGCFGRFPTA